jgi:hypothetical protein
MLSSAKAASARRRFVARLAPNSMGSYVGEALRAAKAKLKLELKAQAIAAGT